MLSISEDPELIASSYENNIYQNILQTKNSDYQSYNCIQNSKIYLDSILSSGNNNKLINLNSQIDKDLKAIESGQRKLSKLDNIQKILNTPQSKLDLNQQNDKEELQQLEGKIENKEKILSQLEEKYNNTIRKIEVSLSKNKEFSLQELGNAISKLKVKNN